MSEPDAIFSASYADWKLIKTRGVVSISFELPIDASGHAYNVLGGMPSPMDEKWFAIARLVKPESK